MARVDPSQMQQVLNNLLVNALQADPGKVHVEVRLRIDQAEPPAGHPGARGRYARIEVRDDGSGVDEQDVAHLFEPFFTTKEPGEGTGLGLSIAHGLVREHGGWIEVARTPDDRTCFSVLVPTGDEA
jgi:two-component system NtrC family sensor kinase